MSLSEDLGEQVATIFREHWSTREGKVVPDPSDLLLGNDGIEFERATILYADLSGSTVLVDTQAWTYAAEVYKAYLHCAAKLIKNSGGQITAYDGDRIMGIFLGNSQTTSAAKCGLKINHAVERIINPALTAQYGYTGYEVKQVVGIDTTTIRAARTGVRGDNDIVWVGPAANYAAKLTNLNLAERTWITERAYSRLNDCVKFGGNPETNIWKNYIWNAHNNQSIYGSDWQWEVG